MLRTTGQQVVIGSVGRKGRVFYVVKDPHLQVRPVRISPYPVPEPTHEMKI